VASVLALAEHGEVAGTASSLMSAIQLGLGSLMIAVSGKLNDGTITMFVGSIAACGVVALVLGAVSLRARKVTRP
jgi:DHA1 family bicyclomycin/chloramphenicol resistance-like MFS transporter